MNRIKKKFGFGCTRLPMKGNEVDTEEFSRMVDTFLVNGFNYFDTAHGYVGMKSEPAIRECLTSRHPRDSYILTDKLTNFFFQEVWQVQGGLPPASAHPRAAGEGGRGI